MLCPLVLHVGPDLVEGLTPLKDAAAYLVDLAKYFHQKGGLFSLQLPKSSEFWQQGAVKAALSEGFRVRESDGCQFGADEQTYVWMSNYDLSGLALRCRCPQALAGSSHVHERRRYADSKALAVSYELATTYAAA